MSLVAPLANAIAIPLVSWIVTPLALVGAGFAALPDMFWPLASSFLGLADAVFAGLVAVLASAVGPGLGRSGRARASAGGPAFAIAGVAWLLAPPGWPARALGAVALLPLVRMAGRTSARRAGSG